MLLLTRPFQPAALIVTLPPSKPPNSKLVMAALLVSNARAVLRMVNAAKGGGSAATAVAFRVRVEPAAAPPNSAPMPPTRLCGTTWLAMT
ncbi:hypothetical protein D9M73_179030 [compost metagenome]